MKIKEDMKKFIILTVVFCMSCGFVNAGQRIQLSQLIGTWELLDDNGKDISTKWEFSDRKYRSVTKYQLINRTSMYEKDYYLSTGIPLSYDSTLVGKVKSGTHIILYSKILNNIRYYEIVSLKDDILTLRFYSERSFGRNAGCYNIMLKRISR